VSAPATHLVFLPQAAGEPRLFLDEAQNVKNAAAQQAVAARELRASDRVALTGTPIENRLAELWSILEFCVPGHLGPLAG